jgi:hypothetical protein
MTVETKPGLIMIGFLGMMLAWFRAKILEPELARLRRKPAA